MGKKTSKTTTTSQPWQPAQGSILGAINQTSGVVGQNQGNLQNIAGGISGYLPQLGQEAFGGSPTLSAANGYVSDVLGGKYLNSNPYMQGMINSTNQGVQDSVNSMFGQAGAAMGTPYAAAMTKQLANADNALQYQDYSNERQLQNQAAGLAPSLYGSQFAGVSPYLAAAQTAGTLPYAGVSSLSPIIGLANQSGQGTTQQPGGWGNDLLSAAMAAAPYIAASDRRLKTNIEKVGEASDGLGIYDWNWRANPKGQKVRGVIADEVEKLRPWAFVPNFVGQYAGVNYGALGSLA